MKKSGLLLLACMVLAGIVSAQTKTYSIASPDKKIQVTVTAQSGGLQYAIQYNQQPIIRPSVLGIVFEGDATAFVSGLTVINSETATFKETWQPVWGFNKNILSHYNELVVRCSTRAGETLNLRWRVFNEGAAFRYEVDRNKKDAGMSERMQKEFATEILSEATEFNMAQNAKTFWQPLMPRYKEHFENRHKTTPIDQVDSCNTPVTMKFNNGVHVSIHEAALINYSSTILIHTPGTNSLKSFLAPWPDGIAVKLKGHIFKTPWRTIQISRDAAGLINGAQMILNLNEPSKIQNTSFIKPMKFNGVWWEMHVGKRSWAAGKWHGATTENTKKHIDWAAANGIGGVLAEGWNTGWETFIGKEEFNYTEPYPDYDLKYLAQYAKEKGVQLISHHETGNNLPDYESEMEAAYKQMQQLGQNAVKTGYVGDSKVLGENYWHQAQRFVQHIQKSVELAAQYNVCLDPHETIKPTGISRTWPNLMSGEGVRGNEWNAWSDGNLPEHETILPFTRGLAGPMDYTPGIMDVLFKTAQAYRDKGDAQYTTKIKERVHTTLAKQLALYVVLYSPLQMVSDLLENYEGQKALQFIRDVPVNWDETKVLNAEIGDYYVVARRNGNNWFVGGVTDENARTLNMKFDFLKPGKKYRAVFYGDNADTDYDNNPTVYDVKEMEITSKSVVNWKVAKGGGVAVSVFEK
jgi:alpha-glucosidase